MRPPKAALCACDDEMVRGELPRSKAAIQLPPQSQTLMLLTVKYEN
jgi:hypothetical protein